MCIRDSARTYGLGKMFPNATAAIIRGMDNAMPVSTQHWYDPSTGLSLIHIYCDIVKDPYVSKINVNSFTYNMLNFLVRTG